MTLGGERVCERVGYATSQIPDLADHSIGVETRVPCEHPPPAHGDVRECPPSTDRHRGLAQAARRGRVVRGPGGDVVQRGSPDRRAEQQDREVLGVGVGRSHEDVECQRGDEGLDVALPVRQAAVAAQQLDDGDGLWAARRLVLVAGARAGRLAQVLLVDPQQGSCCVTSAVVAFDDQGWFVLEVLEAGGGCRQADAPCCLEADVLVEGLKPEPVNTWLEDVGGWLCPGGLIPGRSFVS